MRDHSYWWDYLYKVCRVLQGLRNQSSSAWAYCIVLAQVSRRQNMRRGLRFYYFIWNIQGQCSEGEKKKEKKNEARNLDVLPCWSLNHNLPQRDTAEPCPYLTYGNYQGRFQGETISHSRPQDGELRRSIHLLCSFLCSIFLGQDSPYRW